MPEIGLDQATYDRLVQSYTEAPGNHSRAAAYANCTRHTARKAWDGHYEHHFYWAKAIKDVARVNRLASLAIVRTARDELGEPEAKVQMIGQIEARDIGAKRAAALALARELFADRLESTKQTAAAFDKFMRWIADCMDAHSRINPETVDTDTLAKAMMVAGAYAATMEKFSAALEKAAAAEAKFVPDVPPPPKGSDLDRAQAERIIRRRMAQFANVLPRTGTDPGDDG